MGDKMRKFVFTKTDNKFYVFPVGNHVGNSVFEVNKMGYEILKAMENGKSDKEIVEDYVHRFPDIPTVRNDISNYCKSINNLVGKICENKGSINHAEVNMKVENITFEIQKYYIENNKPFKVFMELTYNCNLKCPHCYVQEDITRGAKFIDKEKVFRLIDEFEEAGIVELNITGGEASLHPDFVEIIRYATSKNLLVNLLTNGQNIYKKHLVDELLDCPLKELRISLYGNEEYHDNFVGVAGAFKRSTEVLKELRKKKGIGTGTYVITNENKKYFDDLKKELFKFNVPVIFSPVIMPTTHGDMKPTELRLSRMELKDVVEKHATTLHGATCTAGISRFRITPEGIVNPCEMMRHIQLGNVYKTSFKEVMEGKKRTDWIEQFNNLIMRHSCNQCKLRPKCNMCPGLFYAEHKDFNRQSSFLCLYASVRQEVSQELEQ